MMHKAPRIAFLIDQLGEGGAQRSAILAAIALHEQGLPTYLLAAHSGSYADDVPQGVEVSLLAPSWPQLRAVLPFAWNLRRVASSEAIDVVFTTGFSVARITLLLKTFRLLPRVVVVVVEQNTLSAALVDRFPSPLARWAVRVLSRWLYRRADAVVGVSDGVSRDLETTLRLPSGSVTTIYNPLDTVRVRAAIEETVPRHLADPFVGLERPIVITTGRLVAQKAHHDLLDAFAVLPERHRGSIVILGEGPLRDELEQQAQRLSIAGRVWMFGFVDNPWWFIARSDVFALSSHWEGFCLAIVEALACGVPVVSTDCPSGPSEILEGVPGALLTPVGDPSALAHAIEELLARPDRKVSGRELAYCSPAATAARYHDVVSKILHADDSHGRRGRR